MQYLISTFISKHKYLMNLISLHKLFLFKRALEQFNRRSGERTTLTHVFLLCALYYGARSGSTRTEIAEMLKKTLHARSKKDIRENLRQLIEIGWIEPIDENVKRYCLTLAGRNALNSLEKIIRRKRIDRI